MEPIIIFIDEKIEGGKVFISPERLKEIVKDAYNSGYADGKRDGTTIVSPSTPIVPPTTTPNTPYTPFWWTSPTCGEDIPLSQSVSKNDDSLTVTGTTNVGNVGGSANV